MYAYQGERWYWTPPSSLNSVQSFEEKYESLSQRSADLEEFGLERGDEHYRRPTMYAMPSIDFASGGVVDSWVDRYGSSKDDFTYVATLPKDDEESQEPHIVQGFYIPVL
ncbi:Geranylgeranyl transferase type-2 subunit alpha [Phytophthora nicotianae]|nr:Geranylgeranyl transferase type-2 subunit alpha [Phytophthora nicotianae]